MISFFQSIKGLFILATLLLTLQHLPLFAANWIPFGDGLYRYEVFYWFYSDFLYASELPRWMPYGTYGMPAAYYQWSALTPLNYLVGLLGKLANTTDTRLLFNIATFLESWTYILGMLLLCERLFSSAAARLLVVLGAVFSLTWWGQPYLNLQVYYALPVVFYFLLRWREEGWMGFLWLAGVVEILSLLGNFPYAAILHFWIGFFFLLPSLQRPWPIWHGKGQTRWLFLLLLLAAAFLTMALASLDGMVNLTPGRQEIGQRVSLQEFLGYARLPAADLLFNQLTGGLPHWEQDNYVGLAPLLLFPFALWRVSSPWLRGLGLVILFLLSLSLGHGLPQLAYYLPGMDHVRHITYLMTTAKMMILLASGFAIQYLAHGTREKSSHWFALFILALLAVELWPLTWTPQQPQPMEAWTMAAGRLLVYGVLLTLGWWWRNKFPWHGMLVVAFLL
ncbi:MAG: hypothetical protein G8345_07635, partial [Magnetococcales bacterium]|nr:hypothetical protein [Magnetococcales bacterium]